MGGDIETDIVCAREGFVEGGVHGDFLTGIVAGEVEIV